MAERASPHRGGVPVGPQSTGSRFSRANDHLVEVDFVA